MNTRCAGRANTLDGHFGLAVRNYTHSTAPNRRFPDLMTQRLLKSALAGRRSPYDDGELVALARHCTVQEDNSAKVERQVQKSAAATLLAGMIGERFDAIVTGASPKGTWVRIARPAVEGRVIRGDAGMDVGDRVRVELVGTDVGKRLHRFRSRLAGQRVDDRRGPRFLRAATRSVDLGVAPDCRMQSWGRLDGASANWRLARE